MTLGDLIYEARMGYPEPLLGFCAIVGCVSFLAYHLKNQLQSLFNRPTYAPAETPDPPTYTLPTIYVTRMTDDWYRHERQRTEEEIAYLVKQEELRETQEWLARRNR